LLSPAKTPNQAPEIMPIGTLVPDTDPIVEPKFAIVLEDIATAKVARAPGDLSLSNILDDTSESEEDPPNNDAGVNKPQLDGKPGGSCSSDNDNISEKIGKVNKESAEYFKRLSETSGQKDPDLNLTEAMPLPFEDKTIQQLQAVTIKPNQQDSLINEPESSEFNLVNDDLIDLNFDEYNAQTPKKFSPETLQDENLYFPLNFNQKIRRGSGCDTGNTQTGQIQINITSLTEGNEKKTKQKRFSKDQAKLQCSTAIGILSKKIMIC
jgi:hypothetical protein